MSMMKFSVWHSPRRLAAIFILSCGIAQAATSAEKPNEPVNTGSPRRCADAQSQLALNFCFAELANKAEKREANEHLKLKDDLSRKSTPDMVKAFELAETKWRDYRDAECSAAESLYAGGSIAPMVNSDCRIRLADQRTLELQRAFASEEDEGRSSK